MKLEIKIRAGKVVVWACWSAALVLFLFFAVRLIAQNT